MFFKKEKGVDWKISDYWYHQFKQRYPQLVLRKSKVREQERIKNATRENIEGFYNKLISIIQEHKLQPHQISNVDKSFIDLNISSKILACKGSDYYEEIKKSNEHLTLISCICADSTITLIHLKITFRVLKFVLLLRLILLKWIFLKFQHQFLFLLWIILFQSLWLKHNFLFKIKTW